MNISLRFCVSVLLATFLLGACGQKGPLFLPGDPSQIQAVPEQQEANEEERDEDDEDPAIIQ